MGKSKGFNMLNKEQENKFEMLAGDKAGLCAAVTGIIKKAFKNVESSNLSLFLDHIKMMDVCSKDGKILFLSGGFFGPISMLDGIEMYLDTRAESVFCPSGENLPSEYHRAVRDLHLCRSIKDASKLISFFDGRVESPDIDVVKIANSMLRHLAVFVCKDMCVSSDTGPIGWMDVSDLF